MTAKPAAPGPLASLSARFTVERELGRGGMGTVHLAHDQELDRRVAIKVLSAEFSRVVGADRFNREIRLTARLVHPSIVPLFDSGQAGESLYYVMPFIDGQTLRRRLDVEGPRPEEEVARIVSDLAEALAYAHSLGIVHRDLKPENIFWYGGRSILADFGIARSTSDTLSGGPATETGMILGTTLYMSPEQASGSREIDGRSDLYSLGCVAFELLSGAPPFAGSNAMAIIAAHLTAPAPALRSRCASASPKLADLVDRLLAKEPDDRPPSAAAVLEALRVDTGPTPREAPAPAADADIPTDKLPPAARDLYRRASDLMMRAMQGGEGSRQKLEMARVYADKAVALAPGSAHALSMLADVHQVLGVRGFADVEQSTARARQLRLEALAADDTVGDVHTSIGVNSLFWEDDFETAGMELKLGVDLGPKRSDSHRHYGAWLKISGRLDEANQEMREAVRLAPEAPFMRVGLADVLMAQGRYAEAIGPLREALRLAPRYDAALERLEMSCHRAGRHDEALDARRMLLGIRDQRERLAQLEVESAREGWLIARDNDLRRELADLLARAEKEDPFQDANSSRQLSDKILIVLAELGEWTQAMEWVERGYYRRPGRLRRVLADLPYDRHGLASDPRYVRLLRTAGLEDLI
ncbi:MAG: serine/threonine-protein kinase [Gemmatimonadota bacterium]